jgi:hypothetical protein
LLDKCGEGGLEVAFRRWLDDVQLPPERARVDYGSGLSSVVGRNLLYEVGDVMRRRVGMISIALIVVE